MPARTRAVGDEAIQEAVHFSKYTVGWSAYLNGMQQDYDEFARELQQMGEYLSEKVEAEKELVAV